MKGGARGEANEARNGAVGGAEMLRMDQDTSDQLVPTSG